MENEQVKWETIKMVETRKQSSKSEVIGSFMFYVIFYRYGYGGFLFWNWTHASC